MSINPFEQIANATTSGGGNYIKDGNYLLKVEKLLMQTLHSGTCFIAEFEVVEAEKVREDTEPNAVGTKCSMVQNFTAHKLTAAPNTKKFMLALLGEDPDDVDAKEFQATVQEACSDEQPLTGALVRCSTYRKWTKDKSKELTLPNWEHVEAEEASAEKPKKGKLFLKK